MSRRTANYLTDDRTWLLFSFSEITGYYLGSAVGPHTHPGGGLRPPYGSLRARRGPRAVLSSSAKEREA